MANQLLQTALPNTSTQEIKERNCRMPSQVPIEINNKTNHYKKFPPQTINKSKFLIFKLIVDDNPTHNDSAVLRLKREYNAQVVQSFNSNQN